MISTSPSNLRYSSGTTNFRILTTLDSQHRTAPGHVLCTTLDLPAPSKISVQEARIIVKKSSGWSTWNTWRSWLSCCQRGYFRFAGWCEWCEPVQQDQSLIPPPYWLRLRPQPADDEEEEDDEDDLKFFDQYFVSDPNDLKPKCIGFRQSKVSN